MFMNKNELKNTLALYKIRSRENHISMAIPLAVPIFLFALDFFGVITQVFNPNEEITTFTLNTYSKFSFFYIMIMFIVLAFEYKSFNKNHAVLPQTNKSRFLSYVLYNYGLFLKLSVLCLVLYLLQYGIVSIIEIFNSNVHLAYDFSANFVIWGFIINIIYGFHAISLIIFAGVLDRKYGLAFRLVVAIITFLMLLNGCSLGQYFMKFIHFWIKEPSLVIFAIKSVVLWFIISGLSWIINSSTIYYKSEFSRFPNGISKVSGSVGIILIVTASLFLIIPKIAENVDLETSITINELFKPTTKYTNIPLSTSHLKAGDTIKVVPNCNFDDENIIFSEFAAKDFHIENEVYFLKVSYTLPVKMLDTFNLTPYMNPKITANLKDTTLYINYEYNKNQRLMFLSPYWLMGQFEAFEGKNLYRAMPNTSVSTMGGNIEILIDDDIKVDIPY